MEYFRHLRDSHSDGCVSLCVRGGLGDMTVLVGMSVCPPKVQWFRRKAINISRARANDSPIQLEFLDLEGMLGPRHVLGALRTFAIEQPPLEFRDELPIRPSRFSSRWGTSLVGPSGSLVEMRVDAKVAISAPRGPGLRLVSAAEEVNRHHWCLNLSKWALAQLARTS